MRIKLIIEYDGTNYVGWQKQKNGRSVQEEIESSIRQILKQKVDIFVAGRTDSGVHALNQVAHFDIDKRLELKKFTSSLNFFLHKSENTISIISSSKVNSDFHSRFSAKSRTYLYKILNRKSPSPILNKRSWLIPYSLNIESLRNAKAFLEGQHDFNSFRSSQCQAKNSIRKIDKIKIIKKKHEIHFSFTAKSFLHNQVRIIVGSLVNVGRGYWRERKILEILEKKSRACAGPTAPAEGLYLEKVRY